MSVFLPSVDYRSIATIKLTVYLSLVTVKLTSVYSVLLSGAHWPAVVTFTYDRRASCVLQLFLPHRIVALIGSIIVVGVISLHGLLSPCGFLGLGWNQRWTRGVCA